MFEDIANLLTSITLILTASIPFALTLKMKKASIPALQKGVRVIQTTTLLLALFLFLHGLYHLSEYIGNDFFSDDLLEPASILILAAFAFYVKRSIFVPRSHGVKSASVKQSVIPAFFIVPGFLLALASNPSETFSLFGILFATGMFLWMAIKNPTPKALHFQFALITLVWAAAEVPHVLDTLGIMNISSVEDWGPWVHFLSMLMIGIFVTARSIKLALPIKKGTYFQETILTAKAKKSGKGVG